MEVPVKKSDIAPTRAERKACWESRDRFWACIDKHGEDSVQCENLRNNYETACPAQWVKHFDRKFVYEQYKKRIENEGYEPIPAPPQNNPQTSSDKNTKSAS